MHIFKPAGNLHADYISILQKPSRLKILPVFKFFISLLTILNGIILKMVLLLS
jgi:hypothetical protein